MSQTIPAGERPRVLVVDDERFIREILAEFLGMEGYFVRTAEDGASALAELSRSHYDLVISDLKMPKMGGMELLENISRSIPDCLTVIMTGFGTVETAIDAMKRGAYDYILKPFKVEEVTLVVQRGIEKQRLAAENLRLREALSLYQVSEAIAASLSIDEVVRTVVNSALTDLRADLATVWLEDGQGNFAERECLMAAGCHIGRNRGRLDPAVLVARFEDDPMLIEQGAKGGRFFAEPSSLPLNSFVAVPLQTKQRLWGWVAVASFTAGKRFDEGQRKLLSIVGSRAAAALENARLYEDLQATFQQTIEGLAKAIDKMDRYTAGHSDRVAVYATFLARRLRLSPDQVEIVRQSALMHDIGKIGCSINLNKTGELSSQEYEAFKKHPGFGKDILEPIKFLRPLIPGVHLHHERWDGRGYPLGLKGDEVPRIARLIAIADTYDAMTSDRAYRRALPHETAVAEIQRCANSQFDPEIAAAFTEGIEEFREECRAKGEPVPE